MKKIIVCMIVCMLVIGNVSGICAGNTLLFEEYFNAVNLQNGVPAVFDFTQDLYFKVDGGAANEITILEIKLADEVEAKLAAENKHKLCYNIYMGDGNPDTSVTQTKLSFVPTYIAIPYVKQGSFAYVKLEYNSSYNAEMKDKKFNVCLTRIPTNISTNNLFNTGNGQTVVIPSTSLANEIHLDEEHEIRFDKSENFKWFKLDLTNNPNNFRCIYDIKDYEAEGVENSKFVSLIFEESNLNEWNVLFSECVYIRPSTITTNTRMSGGVYYIYLFPLEGYDYDKAKFSFATDTLTSDDYVQTSSGADVSPWAKDEIESALESGLVPQKMQKRDLTKYATRAEIAAISVGLYDKLVAEGKIPDRESEGASDLVDISGNDYEEEIKRASELKIATGMLLGDKRVYEPTIQITREDLAVLYCRVLLGSQPGLQYNINFADSLEISEYAQKSVGYMIQNGYMNGVSQTEFAPRGNATREQALIIAKRIYESLN